MKIFITFIVILFCLFGYFVWEQVGGKTVCGEELSVVKIGGCHSDKHGNGTCGTLLHDGTYAEVHSPVEGQKIVLCKKFLRSGELHQVFHRRIR